MHAGGSIETLQLGGCKIDDIAALEQYPLPQLRYLQLYSNNIRSLPLENYTNLEYLYLTKNKIGVEGCRLIAKLLQNDESCMTKLSLTSNNVGDEGAELLADSLKCNTSLTDLYLRGNDFGERGFRAFLKLLNDVSSIEGTYNSNYTLTYLSLPDSYNATVREMRGHVNSAITINSKHRGNPRAAGRTKVIQTQLNSKMRKELCHLQGVEYSYGSIFADIEPFVLPEVLSLVGARHGQNELYRTLNATAPDLVSIVNRKVAIQEKITENAARIAALTSNHKHDQDALTADYKRKQAALTAEYTHESSTLASTNRKLQEELQSIESEGGEQSRVMNASSTAHADSRGKKRDSSAL